MEAAPVCLALAPDGKRFAVAQSHEDFWKVSVHDAGTGAVLLSHGCVDFVTSLDWSPDGRWIAGSDYAGAVWLLESRTGQTHILGHHKAEAVLVSFHPRGRYLVSAGWEGEFICWDVAGMRREFTVGLDSYRWRVSPGADAAALPELVRLNFQEPSGFVSLSLLPDNVVMTAERGST
jgi:WD40 repeat protein